MPKIVNRDLPWDQIRRDWESTPITTAKLARRYGIRSATTIERKRQAEGWIRDVDRQPCPSEPPSAPPLQAGTAGGEAHRVLTGADLLDAGRILGPRTMADAVANQLHTQLAMAVEVQRAGLLLLARVEAVLQPPSDDPAIEAEVTTNLQRLIRVNPDRDTLANLLLAAVKSIETGFTLERRALEAAQAIQSTMPRESSAAGKQFIRDAIDAGPEYGERLRQLALEVLTIKREKEIEAAGAVH